MPNCTTQTAQDTTTHHTSQQVKQQPTTKTPKQNVRFGCSEQQLECGPSHPEAEADGREEHWAQEAAGSRCSVLCELCAYGIRHGW